LVGLQAACKYKPYHQTYLAVTVRCKLPIGKLGTDLHHKLLVVVQLAVHGDHDAAVLVEQGLVPGVGVDDGEALVREEVVA